jgi:hypothetical protein
MINTIYLDQDQPTTLFQRIFIVLYFTTQILIIVSLLGFLLSEGTEFIIEAIIAALIAFIVLQLFRVAYLYILFAQVIIHPYVWPVVDESQLFVDGLKEAFPEDEEA